MICGECEPRNKNLCCVYGGIAGNKRYALQTSSGSGLPQCSGDRIDSNVDKKEKGTERVRCVQTTQPVSGHDDPLDPALWDERLLRQQLEESNDYEERRQLRARLRALMADQEGEPSASQPAPQAGERDSDHMLSINATGTSTAEGAASADVADESADPRGESLLLPLLQGLLSDGGDRLLAGLGSAGADVVADVRRSLARLRAALAPPTAHPNAQALLTLADRLEDALDAADRLDGCKRKPRRRPRSQRHTVGVTQEELEKARLAVDRDQLDGLTNTDQSQSPVSTPTTDPTPPRDDATRLSYHSAVHVKQKAPPIAHSVSYESTPIVNRDAQLVPRRDMNRTDTYRHSIADVDRRPFAQRNGIAAIAQKFDAQVETVATRKGPPLMTQRTPNHFEVNREEAKKIPTTLYRPPPPSYNFAAPPADDTPTPRPLANRRARMKRANTIDIPKPMGTHLLNGNDEKNNSRISAAFVPEFQPQTDNDRKFVAFMQKNEDTRPPWSRGTVQMNWSNRFGNIKNTFESREAQDEHFRTGFVPALSTKKFWKVNDENTTRTPAMPPTSPAAPVPPPRLAKTSFSELQRGYTNGENLSTDAPSPKPFVAKPIPVNQFSHAPMSAFKPPKKLTSPTGTPAHVWSPPSIISPRPSPVHNVLNSPFSPAPPGPPTPPTSIVEDRPRKMSNSFLNRFETVDPAIGSSASTLHLNKDKCMNHTTSPVWPPAAPRSNYPIKAIPNQNELIAPELVKKIDVIQARENECDAFSPSVDVRKLQIEFYEKQIREKNRRDPTIVTNGYHEGGTNRTHSRTFLTPPTSASTAAPGSLPFIPLQQTPDIEKARAHKIDYLPDVVMNNKQSNLSDNEPVEYRTVTRVMRGPISQQATITGGVRTRYDDSPRANVGTTAAKNLKGVLQKFSAAKKDVPTQMEKKNRQERENNRPQVVVPPVSSRESDLVCRPPPVLKYENTSRSPPARTIVSSDSSDGGGRGSARSTPSPGGRFGARRVVARANSMQLLTVPKLYEGGVARDEVTDKRRTVEAYFSGKTSPNVNMVMPRGPSIAARGPRSTGGFALGRSRTMPTVTELQFLDESNTEDAFEDLVSALA
ncbi:hypothetical protein EVAR_103332_1 [Eumeta japonica]|uniref:Smoothelin domain-containing protein n=1 Tax=Eumeta variegata TaxID=151549 RepID=A0A4C1Z3V4_EUMVA|nr:hypothetical protein EVAR_103332_1 [Eumeta japonica]